MAEKTRKRACLAILSLLLVLLLSACGGTEAEPSVTEEDGQNPIMNYIGPYNCDRATILIEANGMEGAKATINWGSSAWEHSEWTLTGSFDMDTLTITYEDCVRKDLVFDEDGNLTSETEVYTDGTGTIVFADDGTLTWNDEKEHQADGMTFIFTPPAAEE